MNAPHRQHEECAFEFHPGYWVAQLTDGQVVACCRTPEELDQAMKFQGVSLEDVVIQQVPGDEQSGWLGGTEIIIDG
jgi:hypothetical protein